ncbi:MAG: hypothetical protein HYZ73_05485 [Elusimicrobia bacterium]|nr:hypothetical protein [Elusimicrobiota bacterium]
MRHWLVQLEDVFDWSMWALFTSSVLMYGYVRFVSRCLPKRRLAIILSWVASIATVYLLGWSSPARQLGAFRVYALMSFVPLTYFWARWRGPTR